MTYCIVIDYNKNNLGDIMINEEDILDMNIVATEKSFLKKYNNIYITDEQVNILRKYDIDINNYNNISELIYDIETYLNDSYNDLDDLEWVSESLSEYNYYNNVNK